MVNGRNKGKRGELEFIALLQEVVDNTLGEDAFTLHRNLDQTRDGGADVEGAVAPYDVYAFEVKRQEGLHIDGWWKQAVEQAKVPKRVPVLAYKQSRKPWKVMLPVRSYAKRSGWQLFERGEVSLDTFLRWYANTLEALKEDAL